MKFCPACKTRLRRIEGVLVCPRCSYREDGSAQTASPKQTVPEGTSEFNVLAEDEGREALPTIKTDCPKCGHDEAVWWMLQTRSADEPTTQFYRCTKCDHTWRDYS